jgi:epithelial splicing regulatory protein 1/2
LDDVNQILLVYYPDGRATGDAFVMLQSEEEASKALLKHKELIGARYIELFRSSPTEVHQIFKRYHESQSVHKEAPLGYIQQEAFSSGKNCVRLRNLPLDCNVEHILEFLGFHSKNIIQKGVHMILDSKGQQSGEAFIQFNCERAASSVVNHKNSKFMFFKSKKYLVEVIQCSVQEMNLMLMGLQFSPNSTQFNQPISPLPPTCASKKNLFFRFPLNSNEKPSF